MKLRFPYSTSAAAKHYFRRHLAPYGILLFCAVLAASLLMLVARVHWILELATHFVPLYALGALAASILLAIARRWRWVIPSLVLLAVHVVLMAPYMPSAMSPPGTTPRLRLLCVNVLTQNTDHGAILEYALESGADVIGIQEVNERWVEQLAPLEHAYPYTLKAPRADNFGIALYSRLPLDDLRIEHLQPYSLETIVGTVRLDEQSVHLRVIHVLPPIGADYAGARNKHLASIGEWARDNAPCIVFGDFNTAMWSPRYRDMLHEGRLTNARRRRGILGTWPAGLYPLSIPIDHCLLSPDLETVSCRRGPNIGSDHFPLLIDVTFAGN